MALKNKLVISVGSSVVQTIVSGIVTFLLFKFILAAIGADKFGIWSIVIATSSMVTLANLGMSGSIVKQVADCDAARDKDEMSAIIQTTVISIAVFSFILVLCAYPAAEVYFNFALKAPAYQEATEILPIALVAFFVMMIAGIYQGAMYGCHLIVQRNVILLIDSISYLLMCIIFISSYGLLGLAYARLAQNVLTLFASILTLQRYVPQLPIFPSKWSKTHFRAMLGYAANFQFISILAMLSDPITKGFLSRYGSISMVGYYEMANRILQILRALLVSANQVLVPTFARLEKLAPERVSGAYLTSYQIMFYLTLPAFCLLAISAPLISLVLIGRYEPVFIWSSIVLCLGWLINTLSVPAYFASIGTGNMRANVISHVIMTALNLALIFVIGRLSEGLGVVIAWSLALAVGGAVMNVMHFHTYDIAARRALPHASRWLMAASLIGMILVYAIWGNLQGGATVGNTQLAQLNTLPELVISGAMVVLFLTIVALPMWVHPLRRRLYEMVASSNVKAI